MTPKNSFKSSKNCRLCLSKSITNKLILEPIPLSEKFSKKPFPKKKLINFPISLGLCNKCKSLQTNEVVNPKWLWSDFTYLSGQTKFIINHFKQLTKKLIKRFKLKKNCLIVDIGSNDGTFLNFFKKKNLLVAGIDPAKNLAKIANKKGIYTIADFFNFKNVLQIEKKFKRKASLILCFNTFAHAENLRVIVKNIKLLLDEKGVFVFECQYLRDIYDKKILGTIFHEHMYHHSITSLKNLFDENDLNFYDVERVNIQKGSIIGYVTKNIYKEKTFRFKQLLSEEKKYKYNSPKKLGELKKFIQNQKKNAEKILKKFDKKLIGSFGSARSGPTYALNFGLSKYINYIFDDHPLKKNRFTSFLNQKVYPTNKIYKIKPKLLIILAYLHSKKIIKNNKKFLNEGGNFLLVFPAVKLINKKNFKKIIS